MDVYNQGIFNQGYRITCEEVYDQNIGGLAYAIVTGVLHGEHGPQWVTWERSAEAGTFANPEYFWGHYFSDGNAALADYHLRLAEHYNRKAGAR